MSRVTFASPSGEAVLRGSERAYAGVLIADMGRAPFSDRFRFEERYGAVFPGVKPDFFPTWWQVSMDKITIPTGKISPSTMSANTAIVAGSDPIRLLARMHFTCEVNGYVEGQHRAWLADVIDEGLASKILRQSMGWHGIASFLRDDDTEPVVMYDSSGSMFPDPWEMGVIRDEDDDGNPLDDGLQYDAWEALGVDEQWTRAMAWLREFNITNKVDMHPDTFRRRRFGLAWSSYDLEAHIDGESSADLEASILSTDD